MKVEPGQTLSASCNVSGHPMPTLQWVRNPNNNHLVTVNKVDEDWREKDLPSNSTVINLHDLQYKSDYHMEVLAVNSYGSSSPAKLNFNVPQPAKMNKGGMGKGAVAGIVMLLFLVLLIAVDATCCYINCCGMLMFLAVKLFGQKVPGKKTVEEGDGTCNGYCHDFRRSRLLSLFGRRSAIDVTGFLAIAAPFLISICFVFFHTHLVFIP
ncbi:neural cell adhesion molecule 1-B-like isoform X3 [Salvelinus alpinus]|uniref:neural cell adhesion molecule 1-B-like isoform X3 n=1 Tax=Salvelinus alpinus TaxID=8036 RepID=UPI0039FC21DF